MNSSLNGKVYCEFVVHGEPVPGADEDAPYFVGRKLYWTEVKEAAPGFLPDGLIVQTYNGRYVVQGGVLMRAAA